MSVNKKDVEIFCVKSIDDTLYKHTHKISLAEVQAAVQKLKVGKSDCVDGFVSDNLKKALNVYMKLLLYYFYNVDSWRCSSRFIIIHISTHT